MAMPVKDFHQLETVPSSRAHLHDLNQTSTMHYAARAVHSA